MGRKKKEIEPNYKLMFESHVSALQSAYRDVIEAKKKELDCWHINDSGEVVRINSFPDEKVMQVTSHFEDVWDHFATFKLAHKDELIKCGCLKGSDESESDT